MGLEALATQANVSATLSAVSMTAAVRSFRSASRPFSPVRLWMPPSTVSSSRGTLTRASVQPMVVGVIYFLMAIGSMLRPRWLPQKSFPPYAYLPGKKPHPVRDPAGHSYHVEPIPVAAEASLNSEAFLWGLDLFNHGYYWEAHEAWEGLWQGADRDGHCACSSRD